jgi:uncharacterized protein (DUF4213/DUF364 family)
MKVAVVIVLAVVVVMAVEVRVSWIGMLVLLMIREFSKRYHFFIKNCLSKAIEILESATAPGLQAASGGCATENGMINVYTDKSEAAWKGVCDRSLPFSSSLFTLALGFLIYS